MPKYISKIPKPLLDQFIQGAVVPFVGSGFSKNADMPKNITMPDWTELGARAAKELPEYEYRNDPLDAISCYEETYSRSSLIKFLKKELHIDSGLVKPNDTYKAFCEVFQDTVLTTNFDSLLETGYRNSGYQCDPVITSKQLPVLGENTVHIIKLHGDFILSDKMTITESDYDLWSENNQLLLHSLSTLFSRKTILFIGYSLNDYNLRNIWKITESQLDKMALPAYCIAFNSSHEKRIRNNRRNVKMLNLQNDREDPKVILRDFFHELKEYVEMHKTREDVTITKKRSELLEEAETTSQTNQTEIPEGAFLTADDIRAKLENGKLPKYAASKTDLFSSEFDEYTINNQRIRVPYKEIFGVQQEDVNFSRVENVTVTYNKETANTKEYITKHLTFYDDTEFEQKIKEEKESAKKRGFENHPPKLWIYSFNRIELEETEKNRYRLELEFGSSGYLEHRVYESVLKKSRKAQNEFLEIINQVKTDRSKFNQSHPVWSRAGAGVWIRTSDNNLIVACRGGNVAEVPGQISYSSSGGCDRWIQRGETLINSTPSVNLAKEIHEELGINIKAEDLKWISFGIDLSGPWMQFSYYAETELDSEAVKEARKTAKDNHEFKMIFIPFEREAISVLLRRTKMEAGAAYSLYELCKKYGYHL